LHIYEVPLADDAGRAIGELHGLTDLELVHNDISDRFLDGIGSLSALAHLTVSHNSRVTDRGMVLCARCPSRRDSIANAGYCCRRHVHASLCSAQKAGAPYSSRS
jgi:hypothetical protein